MATMTKDLESYFSQFVPPRDAVLLEMEEEAAAEGIPIVGPVVGRLLGLLSRAIRAGRMLEIGTATGYSAIFLARGAEPAGGHVVTVEADESMARRARRNVERAGLSHRIEVREGNAETVLPGLAGPFDLVFLDHEKEDYAAALSPCTRLVRRSGLLVADNTGFAGAADFNEALFRHPSWETVPLLCHLPMHSPERDGLSLAVRL